MSLLMVNLRRFGLAREGVVYDVDLAGRFPVDPSGEGVLVQVLEGGVVEDLGGVDPFLELGSVVVLELVLHELVQVGVLGVLAGCGEQGGAVELESGEFLGEVVESAGDAVQVVEDPGIAPGDVLHAA